MNQSIGVVAGVLASFAIGLLASPAAPAQTVSGSNGIYITKGVVGNCTFGIVQNAGVPLPPLPAGLPIPAAVTGPVQIKQFAHLQAEAAKTGAPYSAVGTTEVVQTLTDGNRIVHTNTSRIYRDSSGRTRTEMSLSAVGPFTLDQSSTVVSINDPVSNKRYWLHPQEKRAEILPVPTRGAVTAKADPSTKADASTKTDASASTAAPPLPPLHCTPGASDPQANTVSLGQKTISGLNATGTRIEYTIPAGQIGNEQPITVTSEEWVSEELGVVLSSTRHDPMFGDTQYQLTQIQRSEPDPSLFVVPADYTVTELPIKQGITLQRVMPPG